MIEAMIRLNSQRKTAFLPLKGLDVLNKYYDTLTFLSISITSGSEAL